MIESAFEKLLERVGVSQAQRSQGSTSHQHVRSLLDNKWQNDSSFPWLTDGDFLSGSYARGTKIHPLDDIDVMVVIDGTGLYAIRQGQKLDAEVRGGGTVGNPVNNLTYGVNGHISSKRVIETFRDGLKESYPNSEITKTGQSVHIWLESYGMGIDVVPCFHIIPRDGSKEFYYIPQGNNSDEWMTTNPKIDSEICDGLDQRHNNKFKSVVKIIKHWNDVHNSSRLQSYHLETVASYIFHRHPDKIKDHDSAIRYFFANATNHLQNSCPDMTELGGPVDNYLTAEARRLTLEKVAEANQIITSRGFLTPSTQILSSWRKIFGNNFGS